LSEARTKRIAVQISSDGKQPLELVRTKSLGYSTMNLTGLFELALLGDRAGVDLWAYESPEGGSIRKALDYLLPFVDGDKKWPDAQIIDFDIRDFTPLLLVASEKYGDAHYREIALRIDPGVVRDVDAFLVCWKPAP
jgi:Alginate lyase